ncbi:hypothetical protein [Streptomyces sp. NPDC001153]
MTTGPATRTSRVRQRVKVPWRLVASAHYPDVSLSVYVKIKALALRPEGCTAAAATLARYLGLSKASVERGIAHLRRPAPDGVVELPENTRRSLPGGRGTTARRRVRPLRAEERFVWLPVAACENLTPRQLRAYAILAFAQAQRIPLGLSDLAGFLRHHRGRRAGQPLTAAAAATVVDALEAAQWVCVQRRAGAQGRHRFLVEHLAPAAVPTEQPADAHIRTEQGHADQDRTDRGPAAALAADASATTSARSGEGSGTAGGDGSLADEESPRTDRPENTGRRPSPAVGETPIGETPVGETSVGEPATARPGPATAPRADATRSGQRAKGSPPYGRPPCSAPPYKGPQLTLSPQIYAALEPVHRLLAQIGSVFVVRRIAREVGRQLRAGTDPDRLRARLRLRFARTSPTEIRDPGRWLLGVALPRWGCGLADCESGLLWTTGRRCEVCTEIAVDRRTSPRPATGARTRHEPAATDAPRGNCGACGCRILRLGPALADGLCKPCREELTGFAQSAGGTPLPGTQ